MHVLPLEATSSGFAVAVKFSRGQKCLTERPLSSHLQTIARDSSVRARYCSGLMIVVELGQIRDVG
jgi:hypothetical protein